MSCFPEALLRESALVCSLLPEGGLITPGHRSLAFPSGWVVSTGDHADVVTEWKGRTVTIVQTKENTFITSERKQMCSVWLNGGWLLGLHA